MEATDVRELLRARIERAGSLRKAATELGISAAYLSDIMLGRREPGQKVCDAMGIEKTVIIQRVTEFTWCKLTQRGKGSHFLPLPQGGGI